MLCVDVDLLIRRQYAAFRFTTLLLLPSSSSFFSNGVFESEGESKL